MPVKTVHFVIMLFAACKVSSLCQVQSVLRNECHCWERLENNERIWQIMSGLHVDTSVCITCLLVPLSVFGLTVQTDVLFMKTGSVLLDNWPSHERPPVNLSGCTGNFQTQRPTLS